MTTSETIYKEMLTGYLSAKTVYWLHTLFQQ